MRRLRLIALLMCILITLAYLHGCGSRYDRPGEAVWEAVGAEYEPDLCLHRQGGAVTVERVDYRTPGDDEGWRRVSTPITDVWLPEDAKAPVTDESEIMTTRVVNVDMYVGSLRIWLARDSAPGQVRMSVGECDMEPLYEGLANAGLRTREARRVADEARRRLLDLNDVELTEEFLSADQQDLRDAETHEDAAAIGLLLLARFFGPMPGEPTWRIDRDDEILYLTSQDYLRRGNFLVMALDSSDKRALWWGVVGRQANNAPKSPEYTKEILARVFAPAVSD